MHILSTIKFLCRQGLPLRGDKDEIDSNFKQLLLLKAESDPILAQWLKRKENLYTSATIQNEIIKIMGITILREIASTIRKAPFFVIMADETADIANKEQVTLIIRWVSPKSFEVHEEFIGLYQVDAIDAQTLTAVITDTLLRMNLSITKLRGQCYDGATAMSGAKSGVAKRISDLEPRAVYIHCFGHSLNLAASDTIKNSQIMRNSLSTTHEITKLIKCSPRRDAIFQNLKETLPSSSATGIRVLCPTRWTVKADSLRSILDNYHALEQTWVEAAAVAHNSETKARIHGVSAQMKSFDFFFGAALGETLLRHTDNLSRALQKKTLSAAEGQVLASMTKDTLTQLRTDECFGLFFKNVKDKACSLEIGKPELPRQVKRPRNNPEDEMTEEKFYRQRYYEALDLLITFLADRFDQPGYRIYRNLQILLFKACNQEDCEEALEVVCNFYRDDLDRNQLRTQLQTFGTNFNTSQMKDSELSIFSIQEYFQSLSQPQVDLLSEVARVLQLVLVMPATNATSERSFSALRRVKSYLRSTMLQERLNYLMLLHVHKEFTDAIDLKYILNEFVNAKPQRKKYFKTFS